MERIVYFGLSFFLASGAFGAMAATAGSAAIDGQRPAGRLVLEPASIFAPALPPSAGTVAAFQRAVVGIAPSVAPRAPAAGSRGEVVWTLPSGLDLRASSAFTTKTLFNQAPWPTGGTVPSLKAVAAIGMTVARGGDGPMRFDLAVTRTWQLDAPIGGTYLDCNVRVAVSRASGSSVALQVPCGSEGHFTLAIRRIF